MAGSQASRGGGKSRRAREGRSCGRDASGHVRAQAPAFVEDLMLVEVEADGQVHGTVNALPGSEALVYQALVLGTRDYLGKNGFPGAIIGLSGGVDSALVLAIAADALGADKVRAVMMPSRYTADTPWIDARHMA